MMISKNLLFKSSLLACMSAFIVSCDDDDNNQIVNPVFEGETKYFVGIESSVEAATDVLSAAESLDSGQISPINNGFEQPAWMSFVQGVDQIFVSGYTSAPEFVSYELVGDELVKGDSFFTDLGIYAHYVIDESTLVLVGSPRSGLTAKKIYLVDTDQMSITKTVETTFGDDETNLAFPVDATVNGDKLFIAYYMVASSGDFTTPNANEAKVAVFDFPSLTFDKIITDERAPNIGRYYTFNALEVDEKGDIYTFSPSSLACGYAPVPEKNSGILRIKNGETEFDADYHIDFETLSGGYKINDFYYVGNGKAVVRILKEDEANADYLWATYSPTAELPLLELGIVDLYNETFTLVSEAPNSGGGWSSATLIEDGKLYLGISNSSYSGIYSIDPATATATATEAADIDGNYAKAILSLTTNE